MTHEPGREAVWAEADDVRVTRIGRFLRKSHLDEAPQLWNVIKGDMSLVGPRPEQGAYVEELSKQIPFYTQRHVVKPGITGWAQVRVGYAGSLEGTAFKLCNDLYYVKHHSISLDIAILLETLQDARRRQAVRRAAFDEPHDAGRRRGARRRRRPTRLPRRLPAPLPCLSQKLLELVVELLDPERLGDVGIDAGVGRLALVRVRRPWPSRARRESRRCARPRASWRRSRGPRCRA